MARYLQCVPSWLLVSTVDCWAAVWWRCRASREGLDDTTNVKHLVSLPAWKTCHPLPELECYTADPACHVSSAITQEGTEARSVPGSPLRHPEGSSTWYLAVRYPRSTIVHGGSSPSAFLAIYSPFYPPYTTSSRNSGFHFSTTLNISLLSAMLISCTPTRRPRSADEVVHYPHAWGFTLYSCRPPSLHWLLCTPS